jgi:hypothetical protein
MYQTALAPLGYVLAKEVPAAPADCLDERNYRLGESRFETRMNSGLVLPETPGS